MDGPGFFEPLILGLESIGAWAYAVVFLLVILESVIFIGFFMPGETLLLFVGFLVAQDILPLDIKILLFLIALGATLGNIVSYYLGRFHFRPVMDTSLGQRWQGILHEGESFFEKHGGKSVFLARFTGVFRAVIPLIAGLSRMKWLPFLLWNIAGAVVWSFVFLLFGFYAGAAATAFFEKSSRFIVSAGIFGLLLLAFYVGFRREKKVEARGDMRREEEKHEE